MLGRRKFASVWDALERTREAATVMKMRCSLLMAIEQKGESWEVTQAVAARRLGITQSRLNDLLRGKITTFNLDMLIGIATKADLTVRMQITKVAKAA